MMLENTVYINAPQNEVWRVTTDLERWQAALAASGSGATGD